MTSPPFKMIQETELEKWRYTSFWDKECETLAWIKSFDDGDVFFDVGANIGIYSLYCAYLYPKCQILAFEPHKPNFFRLLDNIRINGFNNIAPFLYCIGDKTGHVDFSSNSNETGSSGGQMKDPSEIGEIPCWSLDDFIIHGFYSPNPTHIKIDIDGQELKVVNGMTETLKSPQLKSVLVEIDYSPSTVKNAIKILGMFAKIDFTIENRFNKMENHSRVRRQKEGINVENIIFTRGEN